MNDVVEKVKIISKEEKPIFIKIEEIEDRKIYHTKIMTDFHLFKVNENQKHKFFISFRGLFNQNKIEYFHLFSIKDGDKFLGIYYGYRKPIKNVIKKYEENGITKSVAFSKVYYMEFRFKKGSVFCYLSALAYLFRNDRLKTKYCQTLIDMTKRLESQIYEFYGKKLPEGGLIEKWIRKNLK
ncbi:DUF226 domain-containing protein [Borrelia turicatae]|uniref:DUF226 domain-containing protein n=2 Tax=Borrelia turicatae TaxID=142 RepID=UPI001FF56383|nr:DUF226 domain-containing protein [Borrelia turicatae]UPA13905.1 DUF226 domain-containing protein [Borrelia turicatae 91E135]UPA15216.1 DUF226 domain-containing protein [Borrelia turicatae]